MVAGHFLTDAIQGLVAGGQPVALAAGAGGAVLGFGQGALGVLNGLSELDALSLQGVGLGCQRLDAAGKLLGAQAAPVNALQERAGGLLGAAALGGQLLLAFVQRLQARGGLRLFRG